MAAILAKVLDGEITSHDLTGPCQIDSKVVSLLHTTQLQRDPFFAFQVLFWKGHLTRCSYVIKASVVQVKATKKFMKGCICCWFTETAYLISVNSKAHKS